MQDSSVATSLNKMVEFRITIPCQYLIYILDKFNTFKVLNRLHDLILPSTLCGNSEVHENCHTFAPRLYKQSWT